MPDLYNVTLAWSWDKGDGNYSTKVWAESETDAVRLTAEEMADSDQVSFDSPKERKQWIKDRVRGFQDVYKTADQLQGDLELLFAKELFGDGPARNICMVELGKVIAENRDRLTSRPLSLSPIEAAGTRV